VLSPKCPVIAQFRIFSASLLYWFTSLTIHTLSVVTVLCHKVTTVSRHDTSYNRPTCPNASTNWDIFTFVNTLSCIILWFTCRCQRLNLKLTCVRGASVIGLRPILTSRRRKTLEQHTNVPAWVKNLFRVEKTCFLLKNFFSCWKTCFVLKNLFHVEKYTES